VPFLIPRPVASGPNPLKASETLSSGEVDAT
jgi:hypothetical protein